MNIIELAKQANRYASHQTNNSDKWQTIRDERFAALVRAAALEEAAVVALAEPRVWAQDAPDPQHRIAAAIRAMKEKS